MRSLLFGEYKVTEDFKSNNIFIFGQSIIIKAFKKLKLKFQS